MKTVVTIHSDQRVQTIIEQLLNSLGREVGGSQDAGNHIKGKRVMAGDQERRGTLTAFD
jgi:hypothetical protein